MTNQTINKLRNKIWFALVAFFFPLLTFGLINLNHSYASFHYQTLQNSISLIQNRYYRGAIGSEEIMVLKVGTPSLESIIGTHEKNEDLFTFEEAGHRSQIISIDSSFEITDSEANVLIGDALDNIWANRFRDRFLWQTPLPLIEFNNSTWFFFLTDYPDTETDYSTIQTFYFQEANAIMTQLDRFSLLLGGVGIVTMTLFIGFAYFFANFLVKSSSLAFEQQKRFVNDASHELKTPLHIVASNCNVLIAEGLELTSEQQLWLNNIGFGIDRMSKLINELLLLAQLDSQEILWTKETFNLSELSEKVLQSFVIQIFDKNIDLEIMIEPEIMVNLNYDKVMQVIVILLDNAIKYVNENGWIIVYLKEIKKQSLVEFSIRNSGPGIPEHKLSQIFERFYRVDESRSGDIKSYGLGLSIAKAIIENLGGKISAASIENQETEFKFTFKK